MAYHRASDGARIFHETRGEGLPCLMIPGLGGESAFWGAVADRLEPSHRMILADHRGAGRSDRPAAGYSLLRIADDLLGVLDDLGQERVHVVGHSTGGMIAQILAVTAPERVASLVLSGTWGRVDPHFRRMFEARIALLRGAGGRAYQQLTQALGYPPGWIAAHLSEMDAEVAAAETKLADPAVQLARLRMLLEHDVHDRLGDIARPCLVLAAPDDALIPYDSSARLAAEIPGARIEAINGGHFFPKVAADAYAARVAAFHDEVTR